MLHVDPRYYQLWGMGSVGHRAFYAIDRLFSRARFREHALNYWKSLATPWASPMSTTAPEDRTVGRNVEFSEC